MPAVGGLRHAAKSADARRERNFLRLDLAIRAVAAAEGNHGTLCRDVSCRWELLCTRRRRTCLAPRYRYRNIAGPVRRAGMNERSLIRVRLENSAGPQTLRPAPQSW